MKILICTIGSYGDVHPFLAIGLALQRRGHDVVLLTNEYFEDLASRLGVPFVSLGSAEDYERAIQNPDIWDGRKGFRTIIELLVALPRLRAGYRQLEALLEPKNTIIIASSLALVARLLQERRHVPTVSVHLSPLVFRSLWKAPKTAGFSFPDWYPRAVKRFGWYLIDRIFFDKAICPNLNQFRREIGLPPVKRVFHRWIHSPQRVIALFPSWYAAPQPDWPSQTCLTGFPFFDDADGNELPRDVTTFLRSGQPPFVFTLGSAMVHGASFFSESVKACNHLGSKGILLTRYSEQMPANLPEYIRHFDYLPFSRLLPHAAALIHHGWHRNLQSGLEGRNSTTRPTDGA
jgi:rhamnosyltransferase subunit B